MRGTMSPEQIEQLLAQPINDEAGVIDPNDPTPGYEATDLFILRLEAIYGKLSQREDRARQAFEMAGQNLQKVCALKERIAQRIEAEKARSAQNAAEAEQQAAEFAEMAKKLAAYEAAKN